MGGLLTSTRFNYFAKTVQFKVFDELATDWRNAKTRQLRHKPEMELSKIEQALSVFLDTSDLTKVDGMFSIPTDIAWIESVLIDGMIEAEKVTPKEMAAIKRSSSISSDEANPFYVNKGGSLIIYPDTVGTLGDGACSEVELTYYRDPVDPVVVTIAADSIEVVDPSSSVDFELPGFCFEKLVIGILELAGLKIRSEMVVQYASKETIEAYQKDNS